MTLVEEKISMLPVIKLGDFGFARSLTYQSLASTLCGSPLYMAPEILKGEKYDAKSDLWSVGTIIYEMMVGRAPFRAQNHIELLKKIEAGWKFPEEGQKRNNIHDPRMSSLPNKSPRQIYPGSLPSTLTRSTPMPADLKDVIISLLKKNPMERMGFEEFFICSTVVACRKLDQISLELFSSAVTSPEFNSSLNMGDSSPKLKLQDIQTSSISGSESYNDNSPGNENNDSLEAPFPEYNHDVGWLKKIDEIVVPSSAQHPTTPSLASDKLSYHSSLASELSNLNINTQNATSSKSSDDDFIVVERDDHAQVNWHQSLSNTVQGLIPEKMSSSPVIQSRELGTTPVATTFVRSTSNSSPKDIEPPKRLLSSSTFDRISTTAPKTRVLGSLRNDGLQFRFSTPEPTDSYQLDLVKTAIPYQILFESISQSQEEVLVNCTMVVCKANAVYRMTNQYSKESKLNAQEILQLYLYCLDYFQLGIEHCHKQLANSSLQTSENYQKSLSLNIQFLQSRFDECLQKAETIGQKLDDTKLLARNPQRIVYETAISTAKAAANAEVSGKPFVEIYKTAILLVEALLQQDLEKNQGIDNAERRNLETILQHMIARVT